MLPDRKVQVNYFLHPTSRLQSHCLIAFKKKLIHSSREQTGTISRMGLTCSLEKHLFTCCSATADEQDAQVYWCLLCATLGSLSHSREVQCLLTHTGFPQTAARQQRTDLLAQTWTLGNEATRAGRSPRPLLSYKPHRSRRLANITCSFVTYFCIV